MLDLEGLHAYVKKMVAIDDSVIFVEFSHEIKVSIILPVVEAYKHIIMKSSSAFTFADKMRLIYIN